MNELERAKAYWESTRPRSWAHELMMDFFKRAMQEERGDLAAGISRAFGRFYKCSS